MPASIVPSNPLIINNSIGKPLPKRIAVALHNAKPDMDTLEHIDPLDLGVKLKGEVAWCCLNACHSG